MNIDKLVQPHLLNLKPYLSARDEFQGEAHLFLDANENAYGNSIYSKAWHRYPDPHQKALKQKIAPLKGVREEQIFLGNGSDESIDLLIRLFCQPNQDYIIVCPPTYGMYEVSAKIQNVKIIKIPLTESFQLDLPAIQLAIHQQPKIIFICSPNNPSGNLIDKESIKEILKTFKGIVAIDEAYIDFASPANSWIQQISEHSNLIVIQTFSKAWGLAGLRLGTIYAHQKIIDWLDKIKPPYNINEFTQNQALNALTQNNKVTEYISKINQQKTALQTKLSELSFVQKIYPSDANFLLVQVIDAPQLYHFLLQHKIVVRNRSQQIGCQNCLRITIGTEQENNLLIEALKKFEIKFT